MKKSLWFFAVSSLVVLTAVAVPAQAQFYLGIRGGLSNENVTGGTIKFDRNSAFLYGAQVGVKLLGFAIEGEYYRADHNLLASNPETQQEMDYNYIGVNAKLGIPLVVVYPYVTAGYGRYSVDLKGLAKDSSGAYNVGAGAEVTLGKLGIFGEIRYTDFSITFSNTNWDFGGVDLHFGLNIHF